MKRLFVLMVVLNVSLMAGAGNRKTVKAHFNETTELVSTVLYLAGADEYSLCYFPELNKAADNYFRPYTAMAVVDSMKKYHERGFGYDAPMNMALRLTIKNGHVVKKQNIVENADFLENLPASSADNLVQLLDEFYRKSNFHKFYRQQRHLYRSAERAFNNMTREIDYNWFDDFFYPNDSIRFDVVLSLLNGPCNYSSNIDSNNGIRTIVCTMGCAIPDGKDKVAYQKRSMIPILIHECCHGYCNPLNEQYWQGMKEVAQRYFDRDSSFFNASPYPNAMLMMNETFVESSVVRYLLSHDIKAENLAQKELADSYLYERGVKHSHWALEPAFVKALDERERHHDLYPTMREFMPRLCQLLISACPESLTH